MIALITGGERGLGLFCALELKKLGIKIVIWGVDQEQLIRVKELGFYKVEYVDVSNEKEIQSGLERLGECPRFVINNAGIVGYAKKLWEGMEEDLVFKVNCFAHVWMIRNLIPRMKDEARKDKNYKANIVSISSVMADLPGAGMWQYAASKAAVSSMMRSLQLELWREGLSDQIQTLLVHPYILNTEMFASVNLFARQDAEKTAKQIIDAMMKGRSKIVIPWYIGYIVPIVNCLPNSVIHWLCWIVGADRAMEKYHSR
jgi:NAD(P)-dependent dehydrogenase (short-subunit alcohol dehydrogenase family)